MLFHQYWVWYPTLLVSSITFISVPVTESHICKVAKQLISVSTMSATTSTPWFMSYELCQAGHQEQCFLTKEACDIYMLSSAIQTHSHTDGRAIWEKFGYQGPTQRQDVKDRTTDPLTRKITLPSDVLKLDVCLGSVLNFLSWQCCACGLFKFKHKKQLDRFRQRLWWAYSEIPLDACPLCSGFAMVLHRHLLSSDPPSCILSPAQRRTTGQLELWDQGVPTIITWSRATAVTGMCYKHEVFPTKGLEEKLVFVSFFRFFFFRSVLFLKMNQKLCCCFGTWLPVCSVLNSADCCILFQHPAEAEALCICSSRALELRRSTYVTQ